MKLDGDWKVKSTPELIEMLYQMTLLHFKDLKRALYGEGNYRLYGKYKKMSFLRSVWKRFEEAKCNQILSDFLENKIKSTDASDFVKSSYSTFIVPAFNKAKKSGQRTRIRSSKTLKKNAK